ncbi:MAG: dTMP kinase [Desulfobacterales bacterium]|jgi:dTMP kinase
MFITLEGIEGSGKTTQIDRLAEFFNDRGMACVTTRQPGGTVIGENIRSILLNPENHALDPMTELLLYLADRAQHINEIIRPALADGKTIICDRYFDATVVYQGFARGLSVELLLELHRILFENLKPDVTLLLDLAPQQGLERAWQQLNSGQRAGRESRFENEALAFHKKVRAGYLELAKFEPQRFHIIDAGRSADRVFDEICKTLTPLLK